jgi:hypothetical protein
VPRSRSDPPKSIAPPQAAARDGAQHAGRGRGHFFSELRILTACEHVRERLGVFLFLHYERDAAASAKAIILGKQRIELRAQRLRGRINRSEIVGAKQLCLRLSTLVRGRH